MYTLGSLFTGIGGIDLGFERAGFRVAFQVENDDYCSKVLKRHWPVAERRRDIRDCSARNLPAVDVLAGGFPCQDISSAGRGAGIKEGTRSGLWIEFARLIGELRPRAVLLENVAAITSRDGTRVIADLTTLGYDAEWGIVPASAVGAPHRRERWWCVAYANGSGWRQELAWDKDGATERSSDVMAHAAGQGNQRQSGIASNRQRADTAGQTELLNQPGDSRQSLAHSDSSWRSQPQGSISEFGRRPEHSSETMGNASSQGLSQPRQSELSSMETQRGTGLVIQSQRPNWRQAKSVMGRAVDGLSRQLDDQQWPASPGEDQFPWEASRTITSKVASRPARLKALGNAVVPQVVQPIAEAIRSVLEEADRGSSSQEPA